MNIIALLDKHLKANLPFVLYKKPNQEELNGLFLKSDEVIYTSNFTEKGFVFAPFQNVEKSIVFEFDKGDFFTERLTNLEVENQSILKIQANAKSDQHIHLVTKTIAKIKASAVEKIVVSRVEEVLLQNFQVTTFYKKLLANYPNAFVYCWYHPKVGFWIGASPETLLQKVDDQLTSVSLAGTQKVIENQSIMWGQKEIDEQQMVTQYITNSLSTLSTAIEMEPTQTVLAGKIAHLKTIIHTTLQPYVSLQNCIEKLHPTPAVCGLPKDEALEFILKNEDYDRKYYTGFLGEINLENQTSHLFVNLRCMEIKNNIAKLFIGGGITKDSDPQKEWEETVAKAQTLKNLL